MNLLGINGAAFIFLSSRRPEEVGLGYSSTGLILQGWGVEIFVLPPTRPPGVIWRGLETFLVIMTGRGWVGSVPGTQKPKMLQWTGQPHKKERSSPKYP